MCRLILVSLCDTLRVRHRPSPPVTAVTAVTSVTPSVRHSSLHSAGKQAAASCTLLPSPAAAFLPPCSRRSAWLVHGFCTIPPLAPPPPRPPADRGRLADRQRLGERWWAEAGVRLGRSGSGAASGRTWTVTRGGPAGTGHIRPAFLRRPQSGQPGDCPAAVLGRTVRVRRLNAEGGRVRVPCRVCVRRARDSGPVCTHTPWFMSRANLRRRRATGSSLC